jgi:hypothetical protein
VTDITVPGSTADRPVFMKMIRDEDGVKWGNIVVMLGVTVLSGYLASRSQRWGASPDLQTVIRMRAARLGEELGGRITRAGVALSIVSSRAYDRARPV